MLAGTCAPFACAVARGPTGGTSLGNVGATGVPFPCLGILGSVGLVGLPVVSLRRITRRSLGTWRPCKRLFGPKDMGKGMTLGLWKPGTKVSGTATLVADGFAAVHCLRLLWPLWWLTGLS